MIEQRRNALEQGFGLHRAFGAQAEKGRLVIACQLPVQIIGQRGGEHLHRLDQAEADDSANRLGRRRGQPRHGERLHRREADIGLAVDEGTVAIEQG